MGRGLRCAAIPVLGALAGLSTLAFDQLAVRLLLGYMVPVFRREITVYLVAGALCGLLATGVVSRLRRDDADGRGDAWATWSAALAVLATATAVGRLQYLLRGPLPRGVDWLVAALVGVAACTTWWLILRSFVRTGRRRTSAEERADIRADVSAGILVAITAGAGLAANRHIFDTPWDASALGTDLLLLAFVLAMAWLVGRFGSRRIAGASAVALASILLVPRGHPGGGPPEGEGAASGPHVVLVVVDTLRQDVFRSVLDETPGGRRFRQAIGPAAYFEQTIATAPWTVPSMASILTGLYPQEHGHGLRDEAGRFLRLTDSVTTLAESFRDAGYRTEALVTNPWLHAGSGIDRGFEYFEELECAEGMLPTLILARRLGFLRYRIYQRAEAVRRRFARRIAVPSVRPIFAWVHFMDPHKPYRRHPDLAIEANGNEGTETDRLYRDEVRYAVREIAALVELLDRRGLWDDTVFLLVSDHGELLRSDGRGQGPGGRRFSPEGHGHALYEELVRVPMVIRPSGGTRRPIRVEALASHVDVAATLRELAGLGPGTAGTSLVPHLNAATAAESRPVLSETETQLYQQALRSERWKLIHYPDGQFPDEIYDLLTDPGEREDLGTSKPDLGAELRQDLAEALERLSIADDAAPLEMHREDKARLRALGYME